MEIIDGYDLNKFSMMTEKRQLHSSATISESTETERATSGDKNSDLMTSYIELSEAKQRLRLLEMKIENLENRISKKYPDVVFLNYKNRKRILVAILFYLLLNIKVLISTVFIY